MYNVKLKGTANYPTVNLHETIFIRGEITEVTKGLFDKLADSNPDDFDFFKTGEVSTPALIKEPVKPVKKEKEDMLTDTAEAKVWLDQNAKSVVSQIIKEKNKLTNHDLETLLEAEKSGQNRMWVVDKILKLRG